MRERLSGGSADVEHYHTLFHLAHSFIRSRGHDQVEMATGALIDPHGNGNYADYTLKPSFPAVQTDFMSSKVVGLTCGASSECSAADGNHRA